MRLTTQWRSDWGAGGGGGGGGGTYVPAKTDNLRR